MSKTQQLHAPKLTHTEPKQLNLALLKAQLQLRAEHRESTKSEIASARPKSVLVLVSGIELAGKGEAVTQLREWMDARYLKVKGSLSRALQDDQPFWQPYVSSIPADGQVVVLFGNWYGDLIYTALHEKKFDNDAFEQAVVQMREFEQDLVNNGVTLIKCWFDLSWHGLQKRLDKLDNSTKHWQQLHGLDWRNHARYETVQALRQQFTSDWFVIDGEQPEQRNLQFGHLVLDALSTHADMRKATSPLKPKKWMQHKIPQALQKPAEQALEKQAYKVQLKELQQQVAQALRKHTQHASVVLVFEGMDAAGKGGAIQRLVAPLDPREYEIHSIAAPESHELKHPYLWRFWTRIPAAGGIGIFDRSWYGRVLVERVEKLATEAEWQRAYAEIKHFEQQLIESGMLVIKFWLSISSDEQLARFEARQNDEHKHYKLTPEDWRNRDKWQAYLDAAADMLKLTSTPQAPWHVIATNDKYTARIEILQAVLTQLTKRKG